MQLATSELARGGVFGLVSQGAADALGLAGLHLAAVVVAGGLWGVLCIVVF